jgi:hypothetical protein
MNILVAPVSGGAFPGQLGGMKALCEVGYDTSLLLASSGGNVSSYITCAADFNASKMDNVIENITPKIFVLPWVGPPLPNPIVGFFQGSLYRQGYGSKDLLSTFFTHGSITKREIWTGTYDRSIGNSTFFCNRSQARSIFGTEIWDTSLIASNEPIYLDGDIDSIAEIANASASIPSVVEPRSFRGHSYVDGGLSFASPLTPMQNLILNQFDSFSLIYVNSYNINIVENGSLNFNLIGVSKWATDELVKGNIVSDRLVGYNMLHSASNIDNISNMSINDRSSDDRSGMNGYDRSVILNRRQRLLSIKSNITYDSGPCPISKLAELLAFVKTKNRSLLEIYPNSNITVDITNFTPNELISKVNQAKDDLYYNLWYTNN